MRERDYYSDPERYDCEYGFVAADLPWYLERARRAGEPVLVLGCGTGRVLFHLARAGLQVDGIDNSAAMLARARTRAVTLGADVAGRVDLVEGDIRDFALVRRYRSILAPLNLLMHLHTDEEVCSCLACVRKHLLNGGRFLFDVTNPRAEILEAHGGPEGLPLRDIRVGNKKYLQKEQHRYDSESKISEVTFLFESRSPGAVSFMSRLRLRMFSPKEIRQLLEAEGFEILEHLGAFSGELFDGSGLTQILVAQPSQERGEQYRKL